MHLWYLQRHNDVIITFRVVFTFSFKHKLHKNNEARLKLVKKLAPKAVKNKSILKLETFKR